MVVMLLEGSSFSYFCKLEFGESDVSPGKTKVKQGKFIDIIIYIPRRRIILKTCKSQNINLISTIPKFNLGIIQITIKSLSTILVLSSKIMKCAYLYNFNI